MSNKTINNSNQQQSKEKVEEGRSQGFRIGWGEKKGSDEEASIVERKEEAPASTAAAAAAAAAAAVWLEEECRVVVGASSEAAVVPVVVAQREEEGVGGGGGGKNKGDDDDDKECGIFSSFDEMSLKETLLRGIFAYGFEKPSMIQQRAIMPVMSGRDVIAQAQSGTGKTATFAISTLNRIDESNRNVQALILAPTRELVDQIFKVFSALGDFMDIKIRAIVGGTRISDDITALRRGEAQVVIGTPGRIQHMAEAGTLSLAHARLLVLDEADVMLSTGRDGEGGFLQQVIAIFGSIPKSTQVALFSATLPLEVLDVTKKFMNDPLRILVKAEELTLEGIKQFYIAMERESVKFATICDLYSTLSITTAIIFCSSKHKVDRLAQEMRENDFAVSCLHGEMDQKERNLIMREFRSGTTRVLITTDVLARGIDVQQVSLVINYDMPSDRENYIHRIGRAARSVSQSVSQSACLLLDCYYRIIIIINYYMLSIHISHLFFPSNLTNYLLTFLKHIPDTEGRASRSTSSLSKTSIT